MISGTFNVEDCKSFSHGRVSGHDTKHHFFKCEVMDEKADCEIPAITRSGNAGAEVSDFKFSNAARTKLQKFCTVWKSNRICNTKCCSGIKNKIRKMKYKK
jgi:hypothetical protein